MPDKIDRDGPITYSDLPPTQMDQGNDPGTKRKNNLGAGNDHTDCGRGTTTRGGMDSGTPVLPVPDLDPTTMALLLTQLQTKLTDQNITALGSGINSQKAEVDKDLALKLQNIKDYYKKLDAQSSETSGFFSGLFYTIRDIVINPTKGWNEFGEMWKNHGLTLIFTLTLPINPLSSFLAPYYVQQFFADPVISEWLAKSGTATFIEDLAVPGGHKVRQLVLDTLKKELQSEWGQKILQAVCAGILGDTSIFDSKDKQDQMNKIPAPVTKYMAEILGKVMGTPITTDDLMDMANGYIDQIGTPEGDATMLSLTVSGVVMIDAAVKQIALTIVASLIPPPLVWGALVGAAFLAVDATTASMELETGFHQYMAAKDGVDAANLSAEGDKLKMKTEKMKKQMSTSMDNMRDSIETAQSFIEETMNILNLHMLAKKSAAQI